MSEAAATPVTTESASLELGAVPALPRDVEGVVFNAPWEAKAFAMVVLMHQRGFFAWPEWVAALTAEITQDRDQPIHAPYYELWLTAAEKLMQSKGLISTAELAQEREEIVSGIPHIHADSTVHHHD